MGGGSGIPNIARNEPGPTCALKLGGRTLRVRRRSPERPLAVGNRSGDCGVRAARRRRSTALQWLGTGWRTSNKDVAHSTSHSIPERNGESCFLRSGPGEEWPQKGAEGRKTEGKARRSPPVFSRRARQGRRKGNQPLSSEATRNRTGAANGTPMNTDGRRGAGFPNIARNEPGTTFASRLEGGPPRPPLVFSRKAACWWLSDGDCGDEVAAVSEHRLPVAGNGMANLG